MPITRLRTLPPSLLSVVALSAAVAACSSSTRSFGGDAGSGAAGRVGTGGVGGGAGTSGAAGKGGAAGVPGTAGGSGTAGAAGSAGTPGAAGETGVAGRIGAGGLGGAGARTGVGGVGGVAGSPGTAGAGGRVPVKHRAATIACSMDRPASSCPASTTPDAGVAVMCTRDADCTAGMNGRCDPPFRLNGCQCSYDQCFADADCTTTTGPCECRPLDPATASPSAIVAPGPTPKNTCMTGNCRVDRDCGAGGYCSPSQGPCGAYLGVIGYYCHTPKDTCVDDADCQAQGGGDCRFDQVTAVWMCQKSQCAG